MQKKRLLHVFATFAVGGPQVRATQLMNWYGDQFEHGIVASDGRYDALELIDPKITAAIVQDYPPMKGQGLWKTVRSTGTYLKTSRWDLLLTYNWGAIETALANKLIGHLPHIHHEEGFGPDEPLGNHFKRAAFRRFALRGANALAVPSSLLVDIAARKWGAKPPFVKLMPNGVDLSLYGQAPSPDVFHPLVKHPGDIWIGCISGLRREKNVPRLVRVAAPLVKANPNVRIVICGTGPEADAIKAEAAAHGIADHVHMMGFQAAPHRYVGLFDIMAIPSDTEQFPICEVEAMAAGIAICGTDVGDVKKMLPPENQPFVVPLADESAFTAALAQLAGAPALRAALGAANKAHVSAHYGMDRIAANYLALFDEAMA
jgi:L-malate glycosyltransferase